MDHQTRLARREFLRTLLLGGAGVAGFGLLGGGHAGPHAALWQAIRRRFPGLAALDAADLIADALGFGPSLALVSEALAAPAAGPAVFRVFYSTSHDIRNELCLIDHGQVYNPQTTLNYGAFATSAQGQTRKAPAPHTILNEWAYQLLSTGKINGTTAFPGFTDRPALTSDELARITVIAAVGLTGSEGIHRRAAVPRVGTLEYAVLQSFPDLSPIGGVALNVPVVDAAGGVVDPGRSLKAFAATVDVPATYLSRSRENNPVLLLDGLVRDERVKGAREQMMDAHAALVQQLATIKQYATLGGQTFSTYGQRPMEGLASMAMFAGMFEQGLASVGSVGLPSYDFHAPDAYRAPTDRMGNMLTETSQALAGTFHIARAALASRRDAIVHFTTCSNRNQTWVNDDSHVSSLTFVIRGSDASPWAKLPPQLVLLPDNVAQGYLEGPGSGQATYSGPDAVRLGLTGRVTIGRLEATLVEAVGAAIGRKPAAALETPAGKLG